MQPWSQLEIFCNLDHNWKTTLMLNVKGRDVSDEEEMELLKGEKFFTSHKMQFVTLRTEIFDAEKGDRKGWNFNRNLVPCQSRANVELLMQGRWVGRNWQSWKP